VLERFPDRVSPLAGLAAQLHQVSSFGESAKLDEAALKLQPDLPEARAGAAERKMVAGELDQALRLLDFLERPGAGQHHSLQPLNQSIGSGSSMSVSRRHCRSLSSLLASHVRRANAT